MEDVTKMSKEQLIAIAQRRQEETEAKRRKAAAYAARKRAEGYRQFAVWATEEETGILRGVLEELRNEKQSSNVKNIQSGVEKVLF